MTGLKAGEIHRLEKIYRRKVPPNEVVTAELGRYLTEVSRDIARQVGVIIDRRGVIQFVIVGDNRSVTIPDLSDYSLGPKRLRGLRLVHTHLNDEPLTPDDMTDLALLRLDLVSAVGVLPDGLPGRIYIAHLLPPNERGQAWTQIPSIPFHQLNVDFTSFITSLEDEMLRVQGESFNVRDTRERAILISVMSKGTRGAQKEAMDELVELAKSADVIALDTVMQRPDKINSKYLMGEGKLREIIIMALQKGATVLIFDQELSPSQLRSISEMAEIKVIDRSQLILDIFAARAHSKDGKVQVELAQLKYRLPMLTGKGTALSRLMGGIGGRGPGESKLETDRRRVRDRISHLEKMLKDLSRARAQRKSRRGEMGLPIISIVGYTNAGKSDTIKCPHAERNGGGKQAIRNPRHRQQAAQVSQGAGRDNHGHGGFHPRPPKAPVRGLPRDIGGTGRRGPAYARGGRIEPAFRGADGVRGEDTWRTRSGGEGPAYGIQ